MTGLGRLDFAGFRMLFWAFVAKLKCTSSSSALVKVGFSGLTALGEQKHFGLEVPGFTFTARRFDAISMHLNEFVLLLILFDCLDRFPSIPFEQEVFVDFSWS